MIKKILLVISVSLLLLSACSKKVEDEKVAIDSVAFTDSVALDSVALDSVLTIDSTTQK
jgi:uncharacterized protein YcfL